MSLHRYLAMLIGVTRIGKFGWCRAEILPMGGQQFSDF